MIKVIIIDVVVKISLSSSFKYILFYTYCSRGKKRILLKGERHVEQPMRTEENQGLNELYGLNMSCGTSESNRK